MTAEVANEDNWGNFSEFTKNSVYFNHEAVLDREEIAMENYDGLKILGVMENSNEIALELSKRMEAFLSKQKMAEDLNDVICENHVEDLEKLLSANEIWTGLVSGCGAPKALEWSSSVIWSKYIPSFINKLSKQEKDGNGSLDDEDDAELRKLMDMHSLIMSYDGVYTRRSEKVGEVIEERTFSPVQSADEVIEEIEEILMTADEQDAAFDNELEEQTGIIIGNEDHFAELTESENLVDTSILDSLNATSPFDEDESDRTKLLKHMSFTELNEELSSLESAVKFLSESLLKELNLRDELLYEKEVRNTFITKILEVQYKQEQFQQNGKAYNGRFKFGKLTKSLSMSNASVSATPGRFLTTVIPFDEGGVPSMEGLQALIKLLDAIKEDSSEVPSLITDYILKVLCPAPSGNSTLNL